MPAIFWVVPAAGVITVIFAIFLARNVLKRSMGTPKMKEIGDIIFQAAWAFLKRQYSTIAIYSVAIAVIIGVVVAVLGGTEVEGLSAFDIGWRTSISFLVGAICSGVAGFIGHRTAQILLERNEKIIGIDNLNDYYDRSLKENRLASLKRYRRFSFYKRDIENTRELGELFKKWKFDGIINLAARAGVGYSIENPRIYMTTNAIGTLNLLELMNTYKVKKMVDRNVKIAYIHNYDMSISKMMVSGVDLWLNTPRRPKEASGTSGMKAAHNGVPHLSTLDGWWVEGRIENITGWSIGPRKTEDKESDDEIDRNDLYDKLETWIVPKFYSNKEVDHDNL